MERRPLGYFNNFHFKCFVSLLKYIYFVFCEIRICKCESLTTLSVLKQLPLLQRHFPPNESLPLAETDWKRLPWNIEVKTKQDKLQVLMKSCNLYSYSDRKAL